MLLAWTGVYPYRCADCRKRIYQRRQRHPAEGPRTAPAAPANTKEHLKQRRSRKTRQWKCTELLRARREALLYGLALAGFVVLLYWGILSLHWANPWLTGE